MTEKSSQIISLLNFDAKSQREPVINSPRSLEACRRQGIKPSELLIRTAIEIKELYINKNLDREGVELMTQHYEEKRREKLRVLIEERAMLIEDEKNGYLSFSNTKKENEPMNKSNIRDLLSTKTDSTVIEKEKKQLERIRQRQEKEIKQLLELEAKLGEIRSKQEKKKLEELEKERLKEIENVQKRRMAEERKNQQELEKLKKQEELEKAKEAMLAEQHRREEETLAREQEKQRRRQQEMKMKEEEQAKRHEEFLKSLDAKARQRELEAAKKKEEMDLKDRLRQEHLHNQMVQKQRETEEKQRQMEEKLKITKLKNEELLNKKKNEFDEKQIKNEEKRRLFELERQRKMEETRIQAEKHAELIKNVLKENEKLVEEKKNKYYVKAQTAEERKKELDAIAEQHAEEKRREEAAKEENRKQVKTNVEQKLKEKVEYYLDVMDAKSERVARTKQQRDEEAKHKHNVDVIKRTDRYENVQRQNMMDQYRRDKLMNKIQEANERGDKIKNDRLALLELRAEVKREMQLNKQSLMEQFEKMKKTKVANDAHDEVKTTFKLSQTTKSSGSSAFNFSAKDQNKSGTLGSPLNRRNSNPSMDKEDAKVKEAPKQQPVQQSTSPGLDSENFKSPLEKETRRALDELRMKQNKDMLRLLEEEHTKQNQREAKLRTITDPAEKKRLEKIFVAEKAKSHSKVQQLSESHEDAIRQYMNKFNIRN